MTNREILKTSKQVLTELERQRHFVLQVDGTPMPCPACQTKVNLFDAAGIDIDSYDFGTTKHAYRCPSCRRRIGAGHSDHRHQRALALAS